ncbi:asparaginase [Psychrobacter sp.]|uniref:asparaginase n=1 Tax=Psychrobacter sp. TaxID=56811 RepID=UPI0025F05360|nr:asparaginase [Psychrobacter sp.]
MTSNQTHGTIDNSYAENTSNRATSNTVQLIYAGGTFGSYGKPLATLPADTFLPLLMQKVTQNLTRNIEALENSCVKDSSQLTPKDFAHFFQLILERYAKGYRHFVLITGTDTLSYLGSFLAEAFAGSDVSLVLTASMRPLFDANDIYNYSIDPNSDAWANLTDTVGLAAHGEAGVFITFAGESWPAQTVQKIHSHDLMAFTGHTRAGYPANSFIKALPAGRRRNWIEDTQAKLAGILTHSKTVIIPTIYCVPNNNEWLNSQLKALLDLPPIGIILMGFGTGNIPFSEQLATTMDDLYQHGHILVCTTQCPYGGVSEAYAAGSWQYKHHVFSAGRLTVPAVYARLLWLHLAFDTPARRRQRWSYSVGKQ